MFLKRGGRGAGGVDVARGGTRLADAPAPATGPGAAPLMRFPPHLYPPRGSSPIFKSAEANLAAAVGDKQSPADLQFELAKGRAGVIVVFAPFIDAPTATSDVTWRLLVNGLPVPGISDMTILGRAAASIEKIFDKWAIEIPDGARVQIDIINNDGVAKRVGMQLEGWDFPSGLIYG